MGQKVNPEGFRLGIVKNWKSRWYEEKDYALRLQEDLKIRNFVKEKFKRANISKIMIERAVNKVRVNIFAARPGIIIGRKGEAIEKTREELERLIIDGKICKGRIAGAEIARTEWMKEGRIPLHTLRADIDYGVATAHTTYGCIGVKVWICKGEVLPALRKEEFESETAAKES